MKVNKILRGSTLKQFIESEKSGGLVLIVCTLVSILLANSSIGEQYLSIWETKAGSHSLSHWINDGLMNLFRRFMKENYLISNEHYSLYPAH